MSEKLRTDKYLWAIRIFKTRTQAALACDQGKVKTGGISVKASRPVAVGETFDIKTPARRWIIEVTELLSQRVAFSEAVRYYRDLTPEDKNEDGRLPTGSFYTGKRQSKIGRPTKRSRRDLDDFMQGG